MGKRIAYNNATLFVSPDYTGQTVIASGEVKNLIRVQDFNFNINANQENVKSLGKHKEIQTNTSPPSIDVNFSYYLTNGYNEDCLGICVNGRHNPFHDIIDTEKMYFMKFLSDSLDECSMAFGNCALTRYSINAGVGSLTTVSVGIKGYNVSISQFGNSGNLPQLNEMGIAESGYFYLPEKIDSFQIRKTGRVQDSSAIGHGNVAVDFGSGKVFGINTTGNKSFLQSIVFDFDLKSTSGLTLKMSNIKFESTILVSFKRPDF
jgi:hypothetical protein